MQLVLATHNAHKVHEVGQILQARIPHLTLAGYHGPEPIEDGVTFAENALIKARAAFAFTGLPAIADDSGIAVEVLGGAPGIFSAGWSGTRDSVANRRLLLEQLTDVKPAHRAASFVCTIALVTATDELTFTGIWTGQLTTEERGEHGFGYDPVFQPDGFDETAAEMSAEVKNAHSHRALALEQLADYLASHGI